MAIDVQAIQDKINQEKADKQARTDELNTALDTYFTDKEKVIRYRI